jgi:hypothetical protein
MTKESVLSTLKNARLDQTVESLAAAMELLVRSKNFFTEKEFVTEYGRLAAKKHFVDSYHKREPLLDLDEKRIILMANENVGRGLYRGTL